MPSYLPPGNNPPLHCQNERKGDFCCSILDPCGSFYSEPTAIHHYAFHIRGCDDDDVCIREDYSKSDSPSTASHSLLNKTERLGSHVSKADAGFPVLPPRPPVRPALPRVALWLEVWAANRRQLPSPPALCRARRGRSAPSDVSPSRSLA